MNMVTQKRHPLIMAAVLVAFSCCAVANPLYFDISDTGPSRQKGRLVRPWKVITLDRDFGGGWVLVGDIDGDKIQEVILATNTTVCIYRNEPGNKEE